MNELYLLPNAEEEIIDSYDENIIVTNRQAFIYLMINKRLNL